MGGRERGGSRVGRTVVGAAMVAASCTCAVDVYSGPPPLEPLLPASPPPTPASPAPAKLRVPSRTNLDRVATIRGQRQPLRAHLAQINANESRTLKNGKVVTLQQLVDALDALETKSQARLADTIHHIPIAASTKAKLAAAHDDLQQERDRRRQMEAAGWKELIERTAGASRVFHPNAVTLPGAAPPPAPLIGGARRNDLPQPKSEPVDLVWQKSWGEPSTASVSVNLLAGNEFGYAQTSAASGCAADATTTVQFLNGQPHELARLLATANATPNQLRGALRAYVLGQSTPVWSRDGVINLPKVERAYSTPSDGVPVPIIGPLVVKLAAQATGTLDVTAGITPSSSPTSVGCAATVTPEVAATLTGTATLQLSGLAQDVVDVLIGSVTAGLNAQLTLLSLSLPTSLGLQINLDRLRSMPTSMNQTAISTFQATLLQGQAVAFLNIDLDWWAEAIAAIFSIDDGDYQMVITQWPGEQMTVPLVNATHTIPFTG